MITEEEKMKNAQIQQLIKAYFEKGGKVIKCRPGTPKDLLALKRTGWQFGGRRTYVATLNKRQESGKGEMFTGIIARPHSKGKTVKYSF